MKRWLAWIIGCLSLQAATAQKTEFSIWVDGNISFFRGPYAGSTAFILLSDVPGPATPDVTIFPYGKKPGFGGAAYACIQKINKKGMIAGIAAGYETITSKVKITRVEGRLGFTPADGTSKITHAFINLFPYVGKRFGGKTSNCTLDVDLGVDVGITLSAHEKGETGISGGSTIITDRDHRKQTVDFRPRLQCRLQKKHIGIQSSFSAGFTNYFRNPAGTEFKAYTNVFRMGIFYTL